MNVKAHASIVGACAFVWVLAGLAIDGCSTSRSSRPIGPIPLERTYLMGFSGIPPRPDLNQELAAIDVWSTRANAAMMSDELPWDSLLAGVRPDSLVRRNQLPLARYYQAKGLDLVVMIDPENGLDRAHESAALVSAGRSITEPAIQQLYRAYVAAMDTLLHPQVLGLALETNLIRTVASPALYQAVVTMANAAALEAAARHESAMLTVSIQAETAWGLLPNAGHYVGVDRDLADFPFIDVLGVSSYPYLAGFAQPEDIPLDYYARLDSLAGMGVLVTEGGWSSAPVAGVNTSPAMQRRYLVRQSQLLGRTQALGAFQLTFTDLDLSVWPAGVAPFAHLGLVDSVLAPKPALAAWDSLYQHRPQ